MTIDPLLQARLLLSAFLCGFGLGCLSDCGCVLAVFLGAHVPPPSLAPLYEKKLPVIGRAVGHHLSRVRRIWSTVLRHLGGFLLPVTAAVCLLLLLFALHRGVFRIGAPLCMLLGFALWRICVSASIIRAIAWLAFLLSACLLYVRSLLVYPFLLVWRAVWHFLLQPSFRLLRQYMLRVRSVRSQRLCDEQLVWARNGLLPLSRQDFNLQNKKGKKKSYVKK